MHIFLNCIGILCNTILKYIKNRLCSIISMLVLDFGAAGFLAADVVSGIFGGLKFCDDMSLFWEFEKIGFLGREYVDLGFREN